MFHSSHAILLITFYTHIQDETKSLMIHLPYEINHFNCSLSTFKALVAGFCACPLNSLLYCICSEDAEHYRYSGIHTDLCLEISTVKVWYIVQPLCNLKYSLIVIFL